jgi:hypothetical protein
MSYKYNEPPPAPVFGPIPEGTYDFTVLDVGELYISPKGNDTLPLKLQVGPEKAHIFDNPAAGTDKNGEPFDKIAQFLKACGRAPAIGQEPAWNKLVGAKGRAHIKIEIAQQGKLTGKEVNKVAYYVFATDIRATKEVTRRPNPMSTSALPQSNVATNVGDVDPDDIPF